MPRTVLVSYLLKAAHPGDEVPDAELLRRYRTARDEAAFELLVRRHADGVWRACRSVTRQDADAEDAFQATFLALAKKPGAVRGPTAAGWLHRVAVRVATKVRARSTLGGEHLPDEVPAPTPAISVDTAAVHEEVARLPDRYRLPVILCELEGQTHAEAAAALGWPVGTVSGRLSRARARLRDRLTRRGVGLPAGGAAAVMTGSEVGALPRSLFLRVVGFGSGAGVPSTAVTRLASGALFAMRAMQMKTLIVPVVALAVAVGGVTLSAGQLPTPAGPAKPLAALEEIAAAAEELAPVPPPDTAKASAEFTKLMDRLKEVRSKIGDDEWAFVVRDMVQLGPDALPALIAALDAAEDNYTIRSLTFVARGIGDKRAIPALIRAFPKTCGSDGSDYGCVARDPDLIAFMQTVYGASGQRYSLGRAITEVRHTLQRWTNTKQGENELNFFKTGGSPRQEYLKRRQFQRCAERWAKWWEAHWKEFTTDERYARVGLPPLKDAPPSAAAELPRGPRVTTSWSSNGVLQSVHEPKAGHVFLDLDTGRQARLPDRLKSAPGQPERLDDIAAWAADEGFDLMGTEYRLPGADKPHYALRGLGLSAWRLPGDCRKTLQADLRAAKPFEKGDRVDGLLLRFDADAGRYDPADTGSYLFRTREDGYGAIFVGIEVHDNTLKNGQMWGLGSDDSEFQTIAFHKGRRYAYTLIGEEPPAKK